MYNERRTLAAGATKKKLAAATYLICISDGTLECMGEPRC